MRRRAGRPLLAARCPAGHIHVPAQARCPTCGARATATHLSAHATLILVTTVRVNPSGVPFRLGLAVTRGARARVLCRVAGAVRDSGHDRVVLEERDGVVTARPARGRG